MALKIEWRRENMENGLHPAGMHLLSHSFLELQFASSNANGYAYAVCIVKIHYAANNNL
jgi:hypothetical protein